MIKIRTANSKDLSQIQQIEREYYEGFSCPPAILREWIQNLPENFLVVEVDGRVPALFSLNT